VATDVEGQEQVPKTEQPHAIDVPGLLAEYLKATKAVEIREALRGGRTIRRGQGYSVRVTAPLALHQATLKQCAALASGGSTPAGRKAYRAYADRIAAAAKP
jgi:putative DNA-invertase from lambdoid prophage Rac